MTSTPADPAPVAAASRPGGRDAAALAGWCALVALAVAVGRSTRVEGTELSLVGPVAAVTFLVCLAARRRGAAALGAVTLLVGGVSAATNLVLGAAPALAVAFGAAHAVHGLVAALVHVGLRRGRRGGAPAGPADDRALHEPADLTALVASALAGSAASALVGPVYLAVADGAPLLATAGEWVLRNVASTVVLAGAVLALGDRRRARRRGPDRAAGPDGEVSRAGTPPRAGRAELVLLQVGAWSVYALVYVVLAEVPVSYATLPLSLLLALRSSPAHAAVHSVVAGVVVVLGTLAGHGPFAMLEPGLRVVVAQGFVVVAASAAMALALYRCQRDELLDGLARAQAAADDRAELLRRGFDDAPAGMALVDLAPVAGTSRAGRAGGARPTLRVANAAFGAFVGVPPGPLAGTPVDRLPAEHEGPGTCALDAVAAGAERATCEHVTARGRRGRLDVTRITPRHSRPYLLVSVEDITAQRRLELALRHRAEHDELTGLPGREVLVDRLGRALGSGPGAGRGVGVLFVDLDGFKVVNDTAGHAAGDELLRVVAVRLAAVVRPDDVVARFGGDEFAVLCLDVTSPSALAAVGARVVRALEEPVALVGGDQAISASVGACVAEGLGVEEVLRRADAAMYEAKRAGRGRVRVDGAGTVPQPRRPAEPRPVEPRPVEPRPVEVRPAES